MKRTSDKFWAECCRERYHWAEESFSAFLQKFDAHRLIQTTDNASRQVSVILYGPAQVGKTSLILTLLGIRDDLFTKVNTLLRGGQPPGAMSTARTCRYRMAKDDFWYFSHRENGEARFSDEEAEAIFAAFRGEAERGVGKHESVDVFLPRRFFNSDMPDNVQLLIRDLPGTHSTNANEQDYVNRLASRYLASADVVLLTGKVDALTFLKPEELDNALLTDWHWQRHRYRVVLTRSYSDATLQRLIKQHPDKTALREFLLNQINTMDLELPESISQLIYPVECGHTWLAIIARDDAFARQCRSLRKEVIEDLLASIQQASNPLSRLRTGYALPHIIERQMAVEKAHYETEGALLQEQLTRMKEHIVVYQERAHRHRKKLAELSREQTSLMRRRQKALSCRYEPERPVLILPSTLDSLKAQIRSYGDILTQRWDRSLILFQLPVERVPQLNNLDKVLLRLNDYWLDKWFRDKTRNEDYREVEQAFQQDANCLRSIFQQRARAHFASAEAILSRKRAKSARKTQRLERLVMQLQHKKGGALENLAGLNQEYALSLRNHSQRFEESKKFLQAILTAKKRRALEITTNMKNPLISRSERLAWLLSYKALNNDFDYIKSLDEEIGKSA